MPIEPPPETYPTTDEVRRSLYLETRGKGRVADIAYSCFFCATQFQMENHLYRGKHIRRYGIEVCEACYAGNWDGWAPGYQARLLAHLTAKGLPIPERNEKGWLPRD